MAIANTRVFTNFLDIYINLFLSCIRLYYKKWFKLWHVFHGVYFHDLWVQNMKNIDITRVYQSLSTTFRLLIIILVNHLQRTCFLASMIIYHGDVIWASGLLKPPVTRMFFQISQHQRKYQMSSFLALCGSNPLVTVEFSSQRASNAERVAMPRNCSLLVKGPSVSWWRHQIETFSALLAICAGIHRSPVNFPHKGQWRGALTFSDLCLNKLLSKQSWGWWFETPSRPLWRHSNANSKGTRVLKFLSCCTSLSRMFGFARFFSRKYCISVMCIEWIIFMNVEPQVRTLMIFNMDQLLTSGDHVWDLLKIIRTGFDDVACLNCLLPTSGSSLVVQSPMKTGFGPPEKNPQLKCFDISLSQSVSHFIFLKFLYICGDTCQIRYVLSTYDSSNARLLWRLSNHKYVNLVSRFEVRSVRMTFINGCKSSIDKRFQESLLQMLPFNFEKKVGNITIQVNLLWPNDVI